MSSSIEFFANIQYSTIPEPTAQIPYNSAQKCAEQKNWDEVFSLYTQAADLGFSQAQHRLGMCYTEGNGVKKDATQAAYWFRRATAQGISYDQHRLDRCYLTEKGDPLDLNKASKLFHQLIAQDPSHKKAQRKLEECHEKQEIGSLRIAAIKEQPLAKFYCYQEEISVDKDLSQTAPFYQPALDFLRNLNFLV